jgi:hypothetical protein
MSYGGGIREPSNSVQGRWPWETIAVQRPASRLGGRSQRTRWSLHCNGLLVDLELSEVALACELGQSMFQPARCEKEHLSIDRRSVRARCRDSEVGFGCSQRTAGASLSVVCCTVTGRKLKDLSDLEGEGRDIATSTE